MEWLKKITDIIMPWPEEEEETVEEKQVEVKQFEQPIAQAQSQPVAEFAEVAAVAAEMPAKKVAAGGGGVFQGFAAAPVANADFREGGAGFAFRSENSTRPNLSVVKSAEMSVKIYNPRDFDQVAGIADDLLGKKAAVVNFEYVKGEEQRRICDFINGVCYVIDGTADIISDQIILYVPEGIDAQDIVKSVSSDAPAFLRKNF